MDCSTLFLLFFFLAFAAAESTPSGNSSAFRPNVLIVILIFTIMFTLAILLLIYAKLCHGHAREIFRHIPTTQAPPNGVPKTVIESLPFFRFAALKGAKEGLECAVCLAFFDDADILRLLPKCKHAFHIGCIDRWLEERASCPLCRCYVEAADGPISSTDAIDQLELELFVERVPSRRLGSSRFGSFRHDTDQTEPDEAVLLMPECGDEVHHKFKHRIIVSEVVVKSRWSDVNPSDLLSLNSEMLRVLSSKRFDQKELDSVFSENDVGRFKEGQVSISVSGSEDHNNGGDGLRSLMVTPGKRCMSEMTNLSRFRVSKSSSENGVGDEKMRRVWLPIARRTLKWYAGGDRRLQDQ